jgi:hypothetical protein
VGAGAQGGGRQGARHFRGGLCAGRPDRRAWGGRRPRLVSRRPRAASRRGARAASGRPAARPGAGRRQGHHCGRVRQGRGRQVDHRGQPGVGPERARPQSRHARCRYLRPVGAETPGDPRAPADDRGDAAHAHVRLRAGGDVDRLPHRGGDADDLARPHGDVGARSNGARST